jgi:Ca2+-binding EF-hand superfamily protein
MNALAVSLSMAALLTGGLADDDPKAKDKGQKRDPAALFNRFDKNSDGKITKDELEGIPEKAQRLLSRADADGDGSITKQEILGSPVAKPGKPKRGEPGGKPEGDKPKPEGDAKPKPQGDAKPKPGGEGKPKPGADGRPRPGGEGKPRPGKGGGAEMFKQLDANADGKISKDEAKGPLANFFDRMDADKDGFITQAEMAKKGEKRMQKGDRKKGEKGPDKKPEGEGPKKEAGPPKGDGFPDFAMMMQRVDSNGDGKVSKEEARGNLAENFARLDGNNDGFLSKEELAEVGKRMKAAKGMYPGFGGGEPPLVNMFNQQDADADGRVTKSEAKGKLAENFDSLDADKDGKLSRQEVEVGMKKKPAK